MTEKEWLVSPNANELLTYLFPTQHDIRAPLWMPRKLRCFLVACCQRAWLSLPNPCKIAAQVADRICDDLATKEEWDAAKYAAEGVKYSGDDESLWACYEESLTRQGIRLETVGDSKIACANISIPVHFPIEMAFHTISNSLTPVRKLHPMLLCPEFLRDIFGNPFRPIAIDPDWLTWRDGTVPKLAQTIYDDRRFDLLPILADALQEAGCTNSEILQHCHAPGPHVRGCWVVDLLLGKV